jgi:hypothetical protein
MCDFLTTSCNVTKNNTSLLAVSVIPISCKTTGKGHQQVVHQSISVDVILVVSKCEKLRETKTGGTKLET